MKIGCLCFEIKIHLYVSGLLNIWVCFMLKILWKKESYYLINYKTRNIRIIYDTIFIYLWGQCMQLDSFFHHQRSTLTSKVFVLMYYHHVSSLHYSPGMTLFQIGTDGRWFQSLKLEQLQWYYLVSNRGFILKCKVVLPGFAILHFWLQNGSNQGGQTLLL